MADFVISSGVTTGVVLSGGDTLTIQAGGTSSDSVIKGGFEDVLSGGLASGDHLTGGSLFVEGGGFAEAIIAEGSSFVVVSAGGIISGLRAADVTVSGGGFVSDVTMDGNGGNGLYVQRHASAANVTIDFGTGLFVQGGKVSDAVISGREGVAIHGASYRSQILGLEVIRKGGLSVAETVSSGGVVSAYGVVKSAHVLAGGTMSAFSGSVLSGLTVSGGSVSAGGEVDGKVIIRAGTLQIGDAADFHAIVSGMHGTAQRLDLVGYSVSGETASWTQGSGSGTLTISAGANVANLTIAGTHTLGQFHLADDGHGGTMITDPLPAALVQAAASVHHGGSAVPLGPAGGREAASAPQMIHTSA